LERNLGYCHCCRQHTVFEIRAEWLRDNYACIKCNSIPRQRHIQYVLDSFYPSWTETNIHESSPSNTYISQYCRNYSSSQYFAGIRSGDYHNGTRCENLESLSFEKETFDIFITQDVLEHIFHPDRAAREIMRVLKPGGSHIFTAPKHKGVASSYRRAELVGGKVHHIHEESYHGNPVGDGRALVTWDYGDDFEDLITEWTRCSTSTILTRSKHIGLDGEYLEVFVTRKA
jgi:SAM-dependent methyltransferase